MLVITLQHHTVCCLLCVICELIVTLKFRNVFSVCDLLSGVVSMHCCTVSINFPSWKWCRNGAGIDFQCSF